MHVHKTKVTRPRPRRYIFKTETRPRRSIFPNSRDRDVQHSRPRRDETFQKTSRDHLETETFKTETTSLQNDDTNVTNQAVFVHSDVWEEVDEEMIWEIHRVCVVRDMRELLVSTTFVDNIWNNDMYYTITL